MVEGSTENTTLVKSLLVGLRERGLDTRTPILAVLDGATALKAAVEEVFDQPVIARCQIHKLRNVRDHLPEKMPGPVTTRIRAAYHAASAREAEAVLESLAKELDKIHPGAAGSWREGMHETLTLARTLRSNERDLAVCYVRRLGLASRGVRPALALNAIDLGVLDSNCRVGRLGAGAGAWREESLNTQT